MIVTHDRQGSGLRWALEFGGGKQVGYSDDDALRAMAGPTDPHDSAVSPNSTVADIGLINN